MNKDACDFLFLEDKISLIPNPFSNITIKYWDNIQFVIGNIIDEVLLDRWRIQTKDKKFFSLYNNDIILNNTYLDEYLTIVREKAFGLYFLISLFGEPCQFMKDLNISYYILRKINNEEEDGKQNNHLHTLDIVFHEKAIYKNNNKMFDHGISLIDFVCPVNFADFLNNNLAFMDIVFDNKTLRIYKHPHDKTISSCYCKDKDDIFNLYYNVISKTIKDSYNKITEYNYYSNTIKLVPIITYSEGSVHILD